MNKVWRIWAKALGQKDGRNDREADVINDYYDCLIECDDTQATCKRICREVLRDHPVG